MLSRLTKTTFTQSFLFGTFTPPFLSSVCSRSLASNLDSVPTGYALLRNQFQNKDTAFSLEERERFGLTGLLPTRVETIEQQMSRCEGQWRQLTTDIDKFIYLYHLQQANETLYFKFLLTHIEDTLPIVYTPTVGAACVQYSDIWRSWPKGMYLNASMAGSIRKILDNWYNEVDIIVVTDGTRILGLGDIGINGHGIPVGKLALYTVGAGFDPSRVLPITLDLGTTSDRAGHYFGAMDGHPDEETYRSFLDEFVAAVKDKWPSCVLQFEDFSKDHAFDLLDGYRYDYRAFNDDIQGTGCVAAAAFFNACRATGTRPRDHTFVFLGAGAGGMGVAESLAQLLVAPDYTIEQARRHFYLVDRDGLLQHPMDGRLGAHQAPFVKKLNGGAKYSLSELVHEVGATAIFGLSATPGAITEDVIQGLCQNTEHPVVFALSNPTSKCEILAQQCSDYSHGKAVYASGSPMPDVDFEGRKIPLSQCNNMYVFPGIGHGAMLSGASVITDRMIAAAATTCAMSVPDEQVSNGMLLPNLRDIRDVSAKVAAAVMEMAYEEGIATAQRPAGDLVQFAKNSQWKPQYH
ncbi:Malic enzyme [Carpediemonas membranifera]|uniref:Malic enzyme n=1 Tax=Carpediemonas membranifera TaxID=201153 RepID=A0A8J6B0I1_9EUKA|nr:Malic enzyme [Carpediemonas membranifera]|eukprot:KAG9390314.1 Malic enzyme [Carpediemonas membranifera]